MGGHQEAAAKHHTQMEQLQGHMGMPGEPGGLALSGDVLMQLEALLEEVESMRRSVEVKANITGRLEVLHDSVELLHAHLIGRSGDNPEVTATDKALARLSSSLDEAAEVLKEWESEAGRAQKEMPAIMAACVSRTALLQLDLKLTASLTDLSSLTRVTNKLPNAQIKALHAQDAMMKMDTRQLLDKALRGMRAVNKEELQKTLLGMVQKGVLGVHDVYLKKICEANKLPIGFLLAKVQHNVQEALLERGLCLDASKLILGPLLRKGSFCEVFQGSYDGRKVAVKIFTPASKRNAMENRSELQLELMMMSNFPDHTNLIKVHGLIIWDEDNAEERYGLVLDLYESASLENVLYSAAAGSEHPVDLALSEKFDIILQIAEAVNLLHTITDRPVVHDDIRPRHILMRKNPEDKWKCDLSVFGCYGFKPNSTSFSTRTVSSSVRSLRYKAPERLACSGANRPRPSADVYAVGVIMAEILSDQLPLINVASEDEVRSMILEDRRPEAELPDQDIFADAAMYEATIEVIKTCWSVDESLRYSSTQLVAAIKAIVTGAPVPTLEGAQDPTGLPHGRSIHESSVLLTMDRLSSFPPLQPPTQPLPSPGSMKRQQSHITSMSMRTTRQAISVDLYARLHLLTAKQSDDAKVLRTMNTDHLEDLVAALSDPHDLACTYDLGGRVLRQTREHAAKLPLSLVVSHPRLKLQNGVIELAPGSQVIVRGEGVCLQGITVRGAGVDGSTHGEQAAGLVWVHDCNATFQNCIMMGGSAPSCHSVLVEGGAAELYGCTVSGSKEGCGVSACGPDSSLVLRCCTVRDHHLHGVEAVDCAAIKLEACILNNNGQHGLYVSNTGNTNLECCQAVENGGDGFLIEGEWSRLEAHGCTAMENTLSAFKAASGAQATLTTCSLEGRDGLDAVVAQDAGTTISLVNCALDKEVMKDNKASVQVMTVEDTCAANAVESPYALVRTLGTRVSLSGLSTLSSEASDACMSPLDTGERLSAKLSAESIPWSPGGPPDKASSQLIYVGSSSLETLCNLLSTAAPGTILDLGGRTLRMGQGGCFGSFELKIEQPRITLLNGILELSKGDQLLLTSSGTWLEQVTVRGAGVKKKCNAPAGLVELHGASQVIMKGCTFTGGAASGCGAVLVMGGSTATLINCEMSGSTGGNGLTVSGQATRVSVTGSSKVQGNRKLGVAALDGAFLELNGCAVSRNGVGGIRAEGSGTTVTACHCQVQENKQHGVAVSAGASAQLKHCVMSSNGKCGTLVADTSSADLEECSLHDNKGCGINVRDAGSRASLTRSKADGNREQGFHIMSGASAEVHTCGATSNWMSGFMLEGGGANSKSASRANVKQLLSNSNKRYGAVIKNGARAIMEECLFEYNNQHGLFVSDGATVELQGGSLLDNRMSGLAVTGNGSRADLNSVAFNRNADIAVKASAAAVLRMEGCSIRSGDLDSVHAFDRSTHVELVLCDLSRAASFTNGGTVINQG